MRIDIEINDDYKSYLKLKKEIKNDERNFKQMYEKINKDAEKFTKDQRGTKVIENDEFYKSLRRILL